jgi:hypothetical protein
MALHLEEIAAAVAPGAHAILVLVKGMARLEGAPGATQLGSSSPRPDTLTRFETGHMRKRSFGAGRNSSTVPF